MRVHSERVRAATAMIVVAALAVGLLAGCGGLASIIGGVVQKLFYSQIIGGVVKLVAKTVDGDEEIIGDGDEPQTRPYVSSDGLLIVYTVHEGTDDQAVWLMNANGGNAHQLIGPENSPLSGPFKPDELIVAFSQMSGDGTRHVFTIRADGEELTDLSGDAGEDDSEPSWNNVGTRIVFESAGRIPPGTWVMSSAGLNPQFIPGTENHRNPVWAPDGTRILSIDSGNRLYTYLPDGSEMLYITDALYATWSPDSQSIVYWIENPDGGYDLMLTAADGSGEPALVGHSDVEPTSPPFWG